MFESVSELGTVIYLIFFAFDIAVGSNVRIVMELQQSQQNIVSLSLLIDYLVQKTYHDLIVLSELYVQ